MVFRAGFAAAIGALLIAADEPPETTAPAYPEPPAAVAERIVDGRFEPGNFEYLRGYFPQASEPEKADYAALIVWLDKCEARGRERVNAELSELGVSLDASQFPSMAGASNACQQVATGASFKDFASFAELAQATRGPRLVFDTLVQSVARAKQRSQPLDADLGADLHHRTLGEQMLRQAYAWGWSEVTESRTPKLNAKERTVLIALLNSELLFVDYENRQWLKQIVAEQGWPTISEVGKRGAFGAWLLAQHADMDPAFQLRALRMMKPLVAKGEVSKRNYAYLYDRTTLKLNIKQRYGTQVQCEDGAFVPQALEEPDRVDELRTEMDLEPLADYLARFAPSC